MPFRSLEFPFDTLRFGFLFLFFCLEEQTRLQLEVLLRPFGQQPFVENLEKEQSSWRLQVVLKRGHLQLVERFPSFLQCSVQKEYQHS